jgi:predicted ATP-dependent endonuclease of OLD family
MRVVSLKISNILSFKYFASIDDAMCIEFDPRLNIIIGQNGAGKSTALEVLNFIFRRVFFAQFTINHDYYNRRSIIGIDEKKQILSPVNVQDYRNFRLDPNWNTENERQEIKIAFELDAIDAGNIKIISDNSQKLQEIIASYSTFSTSISNGYSPRYEMKISLSRLNKTYSVSYTQGTEDGGHFYLVNYNFFKELIDFYNSEYPTQALPQLSESFIIIGGYRNYTSFNPVVTLQELNADQQIQNIFNQDFNRSLNSSEVNEPSIFSIVRLRVAKKHYVTFGEKLIGQQSLDDANNQEFLENINKKLVIVNLKVKISLVNKQRWIYSFSLFDLKRNVVVNDINSLSAGQKAIVHLLFEAYGRGNVKGGLIMIDEPELHLHYQFQNEYLRVIESLNQEMGSQYILVTHSDALIDHKTIHNVKRFALDTNNFTVVKYPKVTAEEKLLVKILDNTKSSYAFFSRKVLLVEGETDRYFYRSLIEHMYPEKSHEISVLDITGKGSYEKWNDFFSNFGLGVYFVGDFDNVCNLIYKINPAPTLRAAAEISKFKAQYSDWAVRISDVRKNNIFILRDGGLEFYLSLPLKGLSSVIDFCNVELNTFIKTKSQPVDEILEMVRLIVEP